MFNEMMPFMTALAIGLMVGLERERSKNEDGGHPIFGVRTLPLLSLLGAVTAYLDSDVFLVIIGVFVAIIILTSHVRWGAGSDVWRAGPTTAVAAMLTFVLGYLAHFNSQIAIVLAVILFTLLAIKTRLHTFVRSGIKKKEMTAVLTFLVSAFVILPLLPNDFVDPWELIHPTRIWLLFVLIAAVEFSSYIALRQLGARWGLMMTGFLGGFVSATATTISLARRAREQSGQVLPIASGVILAETSSLIVQLGVLGVIAPKVSLHLAPLLVAPVLIGAVLAVGIILYTGRQSYAATEGLDLENPISIKRTAIFALLISVGLILIALAARWFGDLGVYVTSALGGAASLRIVTFSVSELASSGEILISVAGVAILLAMLVNMAVKLVIIQRAGGLRLFSICLLFFCLMLASGIVTYIINPTGF